MPIASNPDDRSVALAIVRSRCRRETKAVVGGGAYTRRLATAIRREGRRNIGVLQRIQAELAKGGITRPLIRIFDAILWFSHPAAGVTGAKRSIAVRLQS